MSLCVLLKLYQIILLLDAFVLTKYYSRIAVKNVELAVAQSNNDLENISFGVGHSLLLL